MNGFAGERDRRSLGKVFRAARRRAGLTQEAVAAASQTSVATVRRFELGKHAPRATTLMALTAAIGTTPEKLRGEVAA